MEQKSSQAILPRTGEPEPKDLQSENELLRMKLQTEAGAVIGMKADIPPELENIFLQNVLAFEASTHHVKMVSLYEYLGRPAIKELEELRPDEVGTELARLQSLLAEKHVQFDIMEEYEPSVIYKFITEELFLQQTYETLLPGMIRHFTYEAFHPNHRMEIYERTLDFLTDWFERQLDENSWELSAEFVLPDGNVQSREQVVQKIKSIFACYKTFTRCQYAMGEISYEWDEKKNRGLAYSEGMVKYVGVRENGEEVPVEGPFKFYLSNDNAWWNIFYFNFPGFTWQDEQEQ